MSKYPIFLELKASKIVIIGAGTVAYRKIQSLIQTGARFVVVAKKFHPSFKTFDKNPAIELIKSKYKRTYLSKAALVISATDDKHLNRQIYDDCRDLDILCNTVDQPEFCDFYMPAVIKRDNLQIAISTSGRCPGYSRSLKSQLEQIITNQHGKFLQELEIYRKKILDEIDSPHLRKAAIGELIGEKSFEYYKKNGSHTWRQRAENIKDKYRDNS
jgi:precorrin-2 dehydrogenase/sirohydrochlorin ferrochelatase